MTNKLEDRIKALLEGKAEDIKSEEELLESIEAEELEEANKVKMDKDGDVEVDNEKDSAEDDSEDDSEDKESDDDSEDEGDEEETDTAKDKVKVNEGTDPFGSVSGSTEGEAGAGKTSKIKAGQSRKEGAAGKLNADDGADKQDDAGSNAKIKAKVGSGDKKAESNPDAKGSDNDINGFKKSNQFAAEEHIAAMFNGEDLSEEFKSKTQTIFEAAVTQLVEQRKAELEEEYTVKLNEAIAEHEQSLNEAVEEVRDELVENIDGFLNVVVEQWVEQNQVALERGMKLELVDSFIDGLKSLFKEHYVEVPEEKLDVIAAQQEQIEQLTTQMEEVLSAAEALSEQVESLTKEKIMEDVTYDLTSAQKEKFAELAETIEFTTDEEYAGKLKTIKEGYFKNGRKLDSITEETVTVATDEVMDKYVKAIGQNIKFA